MLPFPDEDLVDIEDAELEARSLLIEGTGVPASVPDLDWEEAGPQLFALLQEIMGGNKVAHDDKYVIEVSHEAVGKAHELLAV